MNPLLTYGDVEVDCLDYFADRLATFPIADGIVMAAQRPDVLPATFLLVRKVSGSKRRYGLGTAVMDSQVYCATENDACDLADLIAGLWEQMPGYRNVRNVRESASPVFVPDTDSGAARYLMTHELTVRGATA